MSKPNLVGAAWRVLFRAARRGVVFLVILLAAGCDLGPVSEAPVPTECTAIGARCQRSDGPIGVCQMTKCAANVSPPCYVCTPQH